MAKGLFDSPEAKKLVTTLRWYNLSIFISIHQLQTHVSTLIRNNVQDVFLFRQNEPRGIKVLYDTWGVSSNNLAAQKDFNTTIMQLEKRHFVAYNVEQRTWKEHTIPWPLPKWRLYLHPSDTNFEGLLLYGNAPNYDLSIVERKDDKGDEAVEEEDLGPTFRKERMEDATPEAEEGMDDFTRELAGDLEEPKDRDSETDNESDYDSDEDDNDRPTKRARKSKDEAPPPEQEPAAKLLEDINLVEENIPQENLTKQEQILKHRILNTFKYLQTCDGKNEDVQTMKHYKPGLLEKKYDYMTFGELKSNYREFANTKNMCNILDGVQGRYDAVKNVTSQFFRYGLGYEGPLTMITKHLDLMAHEDILANIARSNPFNKMEMSTTDYILKMFAPIVFSGAEIFGQNMVEKGMEARANQPLTQAELTHFMDKILPEPNI